MNTAVFDSILNDYAINPDGPSAKFYSDHLYDRFCELKNATNIIIYTLIYNRKIHQAFIEYCFANNIELSLLFINYGLVPKYSLTNLELLKNPAILYDLKLYSWVFSRVLTTLHQYHNTLSYNSLCNTIINHILKHVHNERILNICIPALLDSKNYYILSELQRNGLQF